MAGRVELNRNRLDSFNFLHPVSVSFEGGEAVRSVVALFR